MIYNKPGNHFATTMKAAAEGGMTMKIWDISMNIKPWMTVYKNRDENRPVFTVARDHTGGSAYETRVTLHLHTGTHVDAPLHILEDGSTIEKMELDRLLTRCRVLDLGNVEDRITRQDLEGMRIEANDFLLLKTRNSQTDTFDYGFVYLDESGAQYLRDKKVKGVGIDSLGIERDQPGHPTHRILMNAGIIILEGLRLAHVSAGEYTLIALPLKLDGLEASPVRAVLIQPPIA